MSCAMAEVPLHAIALIEMASIRYENSLPNTGPYFTSAMSQNAEQIFHTMAWKIAFSISLARLRCLRDAASTPTLFTVDTYGRERS